MINFILAPENLAFTISIAFMFLIAILEGIGTILGMGFMNILDDMFPEVDLDVDGDINTELETPSFFTTILSWVMLGKVPMIVLFVIFLAVFGIMGYLVNFVAFSVADFYLPGLIALVPAILLALPIVRVSTKLFAKIIPQEETTAVSRASFIGHVATIILGKASSGKPAQAKLKDIHGQTHYIMVEPEENGIEYLQGTEVLLIEQKGCTFLVIENPNKNLSDN